MLQTGGATEERTSAIPESPSYLCGKVYALHKKSVQAIWMLRNRYRSSNNPTCKTDAILWEKENPETNVIVISTCM